MLTKFQITLSVEQNKNIQNQHAIFLFGILLGGIYRLGVKVYICVHGYFSLCLRCAVFVHVIRRQSFGHCSQALDTQPI